MGAIENKIDEFLKWALNEQSLEDFLEEYDLTAAEAVTHLYRAGLIDLSDILEE